MKNDAAAPDLRPVGILSSLDDAALERLGAACERRTVKSGEVVIRQGDDANELFVVMDGNFVAFLGQKSIGIERIVNEIGPGEVFGEVALLSEGQRTASVRAESNGTLLVLTREMLLHGIRNNPPSRWRSARSWANTCAGPATEDRASPLSVLRISPRRFVHVEPVCYSC